MALVFTLESSLLGSAKGAPVFPVQGAAYWDKGSNTGCLCKGLLNQAKLFTWGQTAL